MDNKLLRTKWAMMNNSRHPNFNIWATFETLKEIFSIIFQKTGLKSKKLCRTLNREEFVERVKTKKWSPSKRETWKSIDWRWMLKKKINESHFSSQQLKICDNFPILLLFRPDNNKNYLSKQKSRVLITKVEHQGPKLLVTPELRPNLSDNMILFFYFPPLKESY